MQIWWLYFTLYESGWYEIVSPTNALSNHDIKSGGQWTFWRAISFWKIAFFEQIYIILPIAARAEFELWCALTALWKVKNDWKWLRIVKYGIRNKKELKFLNFYLPRVLCARITRARTLTDGKFWNAQNDLIRALLCSKSDFEYFKILTRAHVRVVTRTQTRIVRTFTHDLKFMCTKFG